MAERIIDPSTGEAYDFDVLLKAADLRANSVAASAAFTSVPSGIGSVTILAANANRKGAAIVNTDANVLYLDLTGGAASNARHAAQVAANGVYQVPFGYTGAITGVWAADGTGAALVTEFS